MTFSGPSKKKFTADEVQWMHFAAIREGQSLEELEQTLKGRQGVLGKRLIDALSDLFDSEDRDEILGRELLIFDADQDDAWLSEDMAYFVPASEITTELRFAARQVWKALIGALIMSGQEEAEEWFSLPPDKANLQLLRRSQTFQKDPIETGYRLLELLVRGVPMHQGKVKRVEVQKLLDACRTGDQQAARRLEAMAWEVENVNLWRYAMALADGKDYLAKLFADRILF